MSGSSVVVAPPVVPPGPAVPPGAPGVAYPGGGAPPVLGPPRPPWWPVPSGRVPWVLASAALLAGLAAALVRPGTRAGLPLTLLLLLCVAVVVHARRGRDRVPLDRVLAVPAVGLALVPFLRAEALLVVLATLGCLGLLGVTGLERTRWPGLLAVPALLPTAGVRGLTWLVARPPTDLGRPRHPRAWLVGGSSAVLVVTALVALLASADAAFARLVEVPTVDLLAVRMLTAVLVVLLLLGLGTSVAPPRPERGRARPAASPVEWALPLLGAGVVLALFLAVQGAVLLAPEATLAGTGVTPSAWARQGFGQLVVVTLLVLGTLGWAVRRVDVAQRGQRLLLRLGGGLLALLTLGVVASALSRMALYADRFGGTTLRLYVVAFELWLGLVVVLLAVGWLRGRPDRLPRAVVATAAWLLLLLAVVGPEAVVATHSVDRFQRTGEVDTAYLATLSADAVPALLALPGQERRAALAGRGYHADPWYAVNLSRLRSDALLG